MPKKTKIIISLSVAAIVIFVGWNFDYMPMILNTELSPKISPALQSEMRRARLIDPDIDVVLLLNIPIPEGQGAMLEQERIYVERKIMQELVLEYDGLNANEGYGYLDGKASVKEIIKIAKNPRVERISFLREEIKVDLD